MKLPKAPANDPLLSRTVQVLADNDLSSAETLKEYRTLADGYRKLLRKFNKTVVISDSYQARLKELMRLLEETTIKYRQLKEVALPICMYCKNVRSDNNYWEKLETYLGTHADMLFSNGICPNCIETAFKQLGRKAARNPLELNPDETGLQVSRKVQEPASDETLIEMKAAHLKSIDDANLLAPELERFTEKYAKLLRRFNKTVQISDGYQSQLMDMKAQLEIAARTDLLTGLANRWEIMSRLDAETSRGERYGTTFSLLLCDIDHFKSINDTYGHSAGDRILKTISDTFRKTVRNEDICGRWGGEEFLVILPETRISSAAKVAEKLLSEVEKMGVKWEDEMLSVTISIGVGEFQQGMSIKKFIKIVDDALYIAKKRGRNRYATPPKNSF